ncbi:hypothetical protein ED208_09975 [Stagnimonas aquatica]|uniref:Uncharacterized protein n=1 Tax=Stagnimonas aquatica TaxID=2689987 RepID=A0A3N0V9S7_9GAMM|nr:hypothetical protein ED208_09975 [Stagnimonas aquatica]
MPEVGARDWKLHVALQLERQFLSADNHTEFHNYLFVPDQFLSEQWRYQRHDLLQDQVQWYLYFIGMFRFRYRLQQIQQQ